MLVQSHVYCDMRGAWEKRRNNKSHLFVFFSDISWASWHFKLPASRFFVQKLNRFMVLLSYTLTSGGGAFNSYSARIDGVSYLGVSVAPTNGACRQRLPPALSAGKRLPPGRQFPGWHCTFIKSNIKQAPRYKPFLGESTGSLIKGPVIRKAFHVMTSC